MAVHSMTDKAWKTELERIRERSSKDKHAKFDNLRQHINLKSLKEAFDELEEDKAAGIDGVTKADYARELEKNLKELLRRIRTGSYKAQKSRRVEIPKEDGSVRIIMVACLEDKIVQKAVSKILEAIYEPTFEKDSYGFREEHNCHEALKALKGYVYRMKNGALIEIDIRKCFDSIPHAEMMKILEEKIKDRGFLRLIYKLMIAPIEEGGKEKRNEVGCPQGSIISPILSNIFLDIVIDKWLRDLKRSYFKNCVEMVRYADDMVFVFANKREAEKFYKVLPKRLRKYGLEMHEEKSQLLESGATAAAKAEKEGRRLGVYKFLGFTCYWGKAKKGFWRLKFKSRGDRVTRKLKEIKQYLRANLNASKSNIVLERVKAITRGWINYHAISDNERRVKGFIQKVRYLLYKWMNRRGRKKKLSWERFNEIMKRIEFPMQFRVTSMF